MKKSSAT